MSIKTMAFPTRKDAAIWVYNNLTDWHDTDGRAEAAFMAGEWDDVIEFGERCGYRFEIAEN